MLSHYRTKIGGLGLAALLAVSTTPSRAAQPVMMPLEVFGAKGTMREARVDVPASAAPAVSRLWMQIHGLSYANKASVQVNNGPWVDINNTSVNVLEPGKSYGGIGGAFATLKVTLTLPAGAVQAGTNAIRFRFNGTDGLSMGFRVLAFNFLTSNGTSALAPATFVQEDPNTWKPVFNDNGSVAMGQKLWRTAFLVSSPINRTMLKAKCSDCHAQDGRDLKYFNYSNYAIIERAKHHGLSTLQGQQIASYIRSLNVPNPGRPWNPPYQPGPGVDSKPISHWAAGAGLEWVLDSDTDMLPHLFPAGINKTAVATNKTINMREVPIALQLPDWNHWLPNIHPKDAWGTTFINSTMNKRYAGEGTGTVAWNFRQRLTAATGPQYVYPGNPGSFRAEIRDWVGDRQQMLKAASGWPNVFWTSQTSKKVYATALWQLVKLWELMQEFQLEGYGPTMYGSFGESRTWFADMSFQASPQTLKIPDNIVGIGGSALTNLYLTNAWDHLQVILDAGNRTTFRQMEWQYMFYALMNLSRLSGKQDGMRLTLLITKGMQESDNGIKPTTANTGWSPEQFGDVSRLGDPGFAPVWAATQPAVKTSILQAMLGAWFDKTVQFTPQDYYNGGLANPLYIPQAYGVKFGDRVWDMIPNFRKLGVDGALLNSVANWAVTVWPNANWAILIQ
jgi:hypothetical protein